MSDKSPRSAVEAFAQHMGTSTTYARSVMKRLGGLTPSMAELDARLKAEAAEADRDAWASVNDVDIADAAVSEEPEKELRKMVSTRADRELQGRLAAHVSWSNTSDPLKRTLPGREAFMARFEREVDPEGVLPLRERQRRAEHAKKAYFLRLAFKSAQARRKRRAPSPRNQEEGQK